MKFILQSVCSGISLPEQTVEAVCQRYRMVGYHTEIKGDDTVLVLQAGKVRAIVTKEVR